MQELGDLQQASQRQLRLPAEPGRPDEHEEALKKARGRRIP
jgi:hypothetical protein